MNELKQSDFVPEELDITNIEGLFYIADYVLSTLRMSGYFYDDEGNFVAEQLSDQELKVSCENFHNNNKCSYLNYRDNTELHRISFPEACNLSLAEIKEKYLKDILYKAKNIMRKGTLHPFAIPSHSISDEYLDDLFALCWRESLKLWAIRWDDRFKKSSCKEK